MSATVVGGIAAGACTEAGPGELLTTKLTPVRSQYDVLIYGGTLSGILAALRLSKRGLSICVLEPTGHVGGSSCAGLGWADTPSDLRALAGLTQTQFFNKIAQRYGNRNIPYRFEPHVAEEVAKDVLNQSGADVVAACRLHGKSDVETMSDRLKAVRARGKWIAARFFIDASYEGDLMAAAGLDYAVGRDSIGDFGEPMAGYQPSAATITPPIFSSSGKYPIKKRPPGIPGEGDGKVQAYNFRAILTTAPDRIPFDRPDGYNSENYAYVRELMMWCRKYKPSSRWRIDGAQSLFSTVLTVPNGKIVTNQGQNFFGFDLPGASWDYPDSSWTRRDQIIEEHLSWQKGLLYWLANDESLPETVRQNSSDFGYPSDEFESSPYGQGFPHALYVREGRRMKGAYTVTQHDFTGANRRKRTSVCWWRYALDSHLVQYYSYGDNALAGEGNIPSAQQNLVESFEVPAEALIPRRGSVSNIAVSVCISASRTAFLSMRMEPLFAMLGEACGELAAQCLRASRNVQEYNYDELARDLTEYGTSLHLD